MDNWADIKAKKAKMRKEAVADLTDGEKEILMKVLELEWEHRDKKSSGLFVQKPLRAFIQQVIK